MHINTQNNYHKKVYIETPKIFYHDTHKIIKKFFFLLYIKMDQENIMFFENDDTQRSIYT